MPLEVLEATIPKQLGTNPRRQQLVTTNPSIQPLEHNIPANRLYRKYPPTNNNNRSPTAVSKIHTNVKPPKGPKGMSKSREVPSNKVTSRIGPTKATNRIRATSSNTIATHKILTRAKSQHLVAATITTRGHTLQVPPVRTNRIYLDTRGQIPEIHSVVTIPTGVTVVATKMAPRVTRRNARHPGRRITSRHHPVVTPHPPPAVATRIRATTSSLLGTTSASRPGVTTPGREDTTEMGQAAGQTTTLAVEGATTTRWTVPG